MDRGEWPRTVATFDALEQLAEWAGRWALVDELESVA
jgi:hypothetical protein